MRKYLSILIALLAVLGICGLLQAEDKNILTYVVTNPTTTATKAYVYNINNTVEATGIVPGKHRILGVQVMPYSGAPTAQCALLDNASATNATVSYTQAGGLFGEAVAEGAGLEGSLMFPYPKSLTNGLTVSLSNQSTAVIFYERSSP